MAVTPLASVAAAIAFVGALVAGASARATARSGENGSARLQLCDNGPGVPPAALGRLFEPFYSSKAQGTGLGLAIVKRIVEAHGEHITAESDLGRGMTFTLDLPLALPRA